MASEPPFRVRGGVRRRMREPVLLAALLAVVACSPVETYRNLTGASKNDPNPATTPNAKNLQAGAAVPYPNLATVPPPPNDELTEAQLQNLTQNLVADRAHARYSDQQLLNETSVEAPPAPPPTAAAAAPTAVTLGAAAPAASTPLPQRSIGTPLPAAPAAATGAPAVAGASARKAGAQAARGTGASASAAAAPAAGGAAPPQAAYAAGASGGMESGLRKPGEPVVPGPMESSMVSPQIPETPQPEQPKAAPPPPHIASASAAKAPPAAPLPAATTYEPPPPPPVLAAPTPMRTAMAAPAEQKPPTSVHAQPVADIAFAAGSTSLSDANRQALHKAVQLYRQKGGKLRVVGYAGVGQAAADPLNSFRTALDHAQAVADALEKSGIASGDIAVEAAPSTTKAERDHAEVLLAH